MPDEVILGRLLPLIFVLTGAAQRIEFESTAHSAPASYDVGASVRVLYDPERPQDARIRSFVSLRLPIILGGLGFTFTAAGAGVLMGRIPL